MKQLIKNWAAKGRLITQIDKVYLNPDDEKNGIPPLFIFQIDINDIDLERIDKIKDVNINYTLKDNCNTYKLKY